ncbi:VOC family protein [Catenuloplanes atrovinosus]|uniref:Glyoxalase superfamily protein PhnB n=1 Tax=Catenuloplanes atrovinosus TaxID=137266 RepID=A0AAE3YZ74_9ACTN|nr:VOC family protein [Catenuloplanes atrovinosus]MDR7280821.1 putative glyoxalase superfamily protein PhnB [Catenuloplanes atrovinosus]
MSDKNVAPAGYAQVSLFFTVNEAAKALDFYRDVFGAAVPVRMEAPDGSIMHAEVEINGVRFQLSEPMPAYGIVPPPAEGNAFTVTLWVPDPDEVFARAVAAGATPLSEVADVFSGDRMGVLRCPFGVRWAIARHDRDVPVEEIQAAALEWAS